jgi:hypothetical protein
MVVYDGVMSSSGVTTKTVVYWVSPSADVPTTVVYVLARKNCIESEVGYDFAATYNLLR